MPFELGNITTGNLKPNVNVWMPIDESVCGLIFDIGLSDNPFIGYSLAKNNFGNGEICIVHNIEEAMSLGISEGGLLGGVPYYHIKQYYDYMDKDKELYLLFADLETSESPIERMEVESDCKIFQIGIWTERSIFDKTDEGYTFSSMFSKINTELSIIAGNENAPSQYPSGINVIVCGGVTSKKNISYKDFPDCKYLSCENISVLMGGDQSQAVKAIEAKIHPDAQVGMLGLVMASISLAYAEENIGYVGKFNLNKNDTFTLPVLGVGTNDTPISNINRVQCENLISKGYIFPVLYEAKESGVYLSGDFTMTSGAYSAISANRTIHKFKRVAKKVLTPMINGQILLDYEMTRISQSDITIIQNALNEAFKTFMVNELGEQQISNYLVTISSYQPNLKDDILEMDFSLALLDNNTIISFKEQYNTK